MVNLNKVKNPYLTMRPPRVPSLAVAAATITILAIVSSSAAVCPSKNHSLKLSERLMNVYQFTDSPNIAKIRILCQFVIY